MSFEGKRNVCHAASRTETGNCTHYFSSFLCGEVPTGDTVVKPTSFFSLWVLCACVCFSRGVVFLFFSLHKLDNLNIAFAKLGWEVIHERVALFNLKL